MSYLSKISKYKTVASELKPKRLLDFPETRQATGFSCGAAVVQAILYYYGLDVREGKLIKMLSVDPNFGTDPDTMCNRLKEVWSLTVDMKHGMTVDEVKGYIDRKIPVILGIQAWNDDSGKEVDYSEMYEDGHYVVAIGYTDDCMIFEDPSILSNRGYIPFTELVPRWHDKTRRGDKYTCLGLAVYGKTPVYDPTIFKKIL